MYGFYLTLSMGEQVLRLPRGTSRNHHGNLRGSRTLLWHHSMSCDSSPEPISSGISIPMPEETHVPPVSNLRPSSNASSVYPHRRRKSSCRNVGIGRSQAGDKERLPRHTYLRSVSFQRIIYFPVSFLH
ncbi:uncharacterized protein LOC118198120 [Stegodyphus dumicola]|uniref:uncharacterized protein LOC118198120 n=1 Tax=Stegodyphus dumicola TaxID=202533 RepID=UPI0015B21917|nr:uncharacterized protein LOC118198120 [Stegodyphus dumicola]